MEFYVWKKFKNLEKQENFYSFKRIFLYRGLLKK